MVDNIDKSKCTGCKMCADVCPQNAIFFETDEHGFWYPKVDDRCNQCGLCIKKCPSFNIYTCKRNEPTVFSAWSKDDNIRLSSTSGGIFWEVAHKFIIEGGVVVGSSYCSDWKSAEHIVARTEKELYALKGSKYFQSDTKGIYKEVKQYLDKDIKVLFCGTPCQVSALGSYLGREYKNLYLLDFICRSINSPKAFRAYIEELEQVYNSKACEVQLKNKKYGWQSLSSRVSFENGSESVLDRNKDLWVKGFIENDLYTRESCFFCQYRVLPRLNSDITIGDFWGIIGQTENDLFKGISAILINTEKGRELFEIISDKIEYRTHSLKEVLVGNKALLDSPVKTKKRDRFFVLLKKHPFSYCVKKCIKEPWGDIVLNRFRFLVKLVQKTKWALFESDISIVKYIYYNYFCKKIIRKSNAKIIPRKNAIIDLKRGASIVLCGTKNLDIGINRLRGSKSETHVRLNENAVWNCNNGADLFYGTVIEIKKNAIINSGYLSANGGSVIVAHKNINIGEDVMIGRNVIIYDSDFHTIYDEEGEACNPPQTVVIEDHVWLTSNIVVQKGVTLGKDSLITSFTTVNRDVPPHTIYGGKSVGTMIKEQVSWSRETCPLK